MNIRKPNNSKSTEKKFDKSKQKKDNPLKKKSFNKEDNPQRRFIKENTSDADKKKTFNNDRKNERHNDNKKSQPSYGKRFVKDEKKHDNSKSRKTTFIKDKSKTETRSERTEKSFDKRRSGIKRDAVSANGDSVRLNKYIANAGICSRRDADVLIQSGNVTVNGEIVTELGIKVYPGDKVNYDGKLLLNEKKVYLLLNKPKDYITTSDDPQKRRTVLSLISGACKERIYPVGRLDRMTTGVLLFTNDGDLVKKLTHPKHGVKKVYHAVLDKNFSKPDMIKVIEGVELEDGVVDVDKISYIADASDKKEIGIELHSGKNRIVRRLFENLGYNVVKLDRVSFAGLTKKNLQKGHWRFLTPKEVCFLQMLK